VASVAAVARASGGSPVWATVGLLGVVTSALILSVHSVTGGWALAYLLATVRHGLAGDTAMVVVARYAALLASPARMTAYHTLCMVLTALIVARGIADGIERASRHLMPILIVLTHMVRRSVAPLGIAAPTVAPFVL
jgi:NSS family neurotransmitter:Na+ symporter